MRWQWGWVLSIYRKECFLENRTEVLQDDPNNTQVIKSRPELQISNYKQYEIDFEKIRNLRRCRKCVLPETMPFIEFDDNGVCNYCKTYKKVEYRGKDALNSLERRVSEK